MSDDINIHWEEMPTDDIFSPKQKAKAIPEKKKEPLSIDDTLYDSLYEELLVKSNPANYVGEKYDYKKATVANEIYAQLLVCSKIDMIALRNYRTMITEKMGVLFSTEHIYPYLCTACDPQQFTGENYDAEKFKFTNNLYKELQCAQYDIDKVEALYELYVAYTKVIIPLHNKREQEMAILWKQLREKEEEKRERERIEEMELKQKELQRIEEAENERREDERYATMMVCSLGILVLMVSLILGLCDL